MAAKLKEEKSLPKFFKLRLQTKWHYILLFSIPCLALFYLYFFPLGPTLSKAQMEWKEFQGDDPKGYPLEVVSHGYRMIRAYQSKPQKKPSTESRKANLVEWEWYVTVKNKSNRDSEVYVSYSLVDKDRLPVDVDFLIAKKPILAWETVTFEHKTDMIYEDLPRVSTGVWEISRAEGKSSLKNRRKGF